MSQVDIFAPPSTIDAAFWKFHRENPQVLKQLIRMTVAAKLRGHTRVGMKMMFEVIRWEHLLQTHGDNFLLNNSFTSRYARLLSEQRPELVSMFETRRLHS